MSESKVDGEEGRGRADVMEDADETTISSRKRPNEILFVRVHAMGRSRSFRLSYGHWGRLAMCVGYS